MSSLAKLIQWRRELHQYPEISGQEYQTSERIKKWLTQANIKIADYSLETGVIAEIGQGDKIVALRADIDALAIEEKTNLPFSSVNKGLMHACGHDIHIAVMLGAAISLKHKESELNGKVRIIFQPAEESFEGAKAIIKSGALKDVSAIFGMHNEPELPVGTFATKNGPFYASVDRILIKITGKGAHAARPQEGIDPIVISAQLINQFQSIITRQINTNETAVLSITRISGGNTWNVIPEEVELEGTLRTHNEKIRQTIKEALKLACKGMELTSRASVDLKFIKGPNTLINDTFWANSTIEIAHESGYEVVQASKHLGGEDFAAYLEAIPGAFVSIGSQSEFGLHHPKFNPDESCIEAAANYFKNLALHALAIA
ncbi:amidohydrolase [Thorsellia kenyensis]|uniref:Amidohydrolase n=1 Tax=Thorsellia kenyensis TaxID=1549888 RepID=A0ABV6CD87_9GAMM